jgi:hypothetical protein
MPVTDDGYGFAGRCRQCARRRHSRRRPDGHGGGRAATSAATSALTRPLRAADRSQAPRYRGISSATQFRMRWRRTGRLGRRDSNLCILYFDRNSPRLSAQGAELELAYLELKMRRVAQRAGGLSCRKTASFYCSVNICRNLPSQGNRRWLRRSPDRTKSNTGVLVASRSNSSLQWQPTIRSGCPDCSQPSLDTDILPKSRQIKLIQTHPIRPNDATKGNTTETPTSTACRSQSLDKALQPAKIWHMGQ